MTYGSPKWRPWVLDEEASLPFFKAAVEAGINFFDTADVYSLGESERVTGKALKEYAKRHEVVIATKVFSPMGGDPNNRGLSRKHIFDASTTSTSTRSTASIRTRRSKRRWRR
jgi:aryl-alcohol dehydrogenase-like predicted oxidoreductase